MSDLSGIRSFPATPQATPLSPPAIAIQQTRPHPAELRETMLRLPNSVSPSASLSELFTPPPAPPSPAPPPLPPMPPTPPSTSTTTSTSASDPPTQNKSQYLRSASPYHRQNSAQGAHRVPLPASPGLKGRRYSPSPLSRGDGGGGDVDGHGGRGEIVRSASPLGKGAGRTAGDATSDLNTYEERTRDLDDGGLNAQALDAMIADAGKADNDDDDDGEGERGKEDREGTLVEQTIQGKPMTSPRSPRGAHRVDLDDSKRLHRSASIRSAKDVSSLPNSPKSSPPLPPPTGAGTTNPTTPTRTSMESVGQTNKPGMLSPTPSSKSGAERSHRSIASTTSAASTIVSDTNSTLSPASSIEGSPVREGPKLSLKNRRRLRKRKEETDENHALYSMNPTSSLHVSSSTFDLPQLQRVKSVSGASTKTNKSVASVFSSVSKKSITLPTLPWQRKEKGERFEQLEDSGFFERTELPPKKVTRLPILTIAPTNTTGAQESGAAEHGSVLLTPGAFYDNKRQSVRFSWNVQPDGDEETAKRDLWLPANRFSGAIRESEGVVDAVEDQRISKLARLSALPPVTELENTSEERPQSNEDNEEDDNDVPPSKKKARWSLYAASMPDTPTSSSIDKHVDDTAEKTQHTGLDTTDSDTPTAKRASWMLSTGSPATSPKEVRVLAAVPDEENLAATDNDSSSCEDWPLKIFASYDVPERAEVLAVIAEEDEEDIAESEDALDGRAPDSEQASWPMMVVSPGLPPMKLVGMASIDEEAGAETDVPENGSDEETPEKTSSPELPEIAPLRSRSSSKRGSDEFKEGEQIVALVPYQHGPMKRQKPQDMLNAGPLAGMNISMWDDDSSTEAWEKAEAMLVDGILDYFSSMLGTSEAACGAMESSDDEAEQADWQYLSAPLLDDALIQEHAHGIKTGKAERQRAKRPPPLPPLPPPPPAIRDDLSPPPPLPPTPPTPQAASRPDSMALQRPSMARAKSAKAKGVHSPSFGSLLLKRNIF